jgi:hypothetical protein
MSQHDVVVNLDINMAKADTELRQLETLLFRIMSLLGRLGLPPGADAAIAKIQRLIMIVRLAHTSLIALEAASGPIGWALAGVGIVSTAVSAGDYVYDSLQGK